MAELDRKHESRICELVRIEESEATTLLPHPLRGWERNPIAEPVEPVHVMVDLGECPSLTDQGAAVPAPIRTLLRQAMNRGPMRYF